MIRLATRATTGGAVAYPSVGDLPLSIVGGIGPLAGTRVYPAWIRNSADFGTPSTFNLTNGLRVEWSG